MNDFPFKFTMPTRGLEGDEPSEGLVTLTRIIYRHGMLTGNEVLEILGRGWTKDDGDNG